MEIVSATEMKNNFGKYLNMIAMGKEIIITKNGKEIARLLPKDKVSSFLTDSLTGVLKDMDEDFRERALKEKYGIDD